MTHRKATAGRTAIRGRRGLLRGLGAALPVVTLLVAAAAPCRAAWPGDPSANLPICVSPVDQDLPQIVPDDSGGVVIAWQATGISGVKRIFAQRVDRDGRAVWASNGIAVCPHPGDQQHPMLVPDSSGGAVVVWQDYRSGTSWDLYAQRIDRSGVLRWSDGGVPVSTAGGDQLGPQIASDGRGGAFVAWRDLRDAPRSDLYAQAIDRAGQARWAPDGIPMLASPEAQLVSAVVTGGAGGVVVWRDSLGGNGDTRLLAQRVDAAGNPLWDPAGILVNDGAAPDARPVTVPDGAGGVIIAWESGPLYAQRLDPRGRLLWGDDGIALSTDDAWAPAIVPDGEGGAIVAWQTESLEDEASDVRAQSVRASGTLRWGADGIAVCLASGAQTEVAATRAAAGGAIVIWRDARDDPFGDLYAQRVDSTGTVLWRTDGVVVSDAPGFQSSLAACSDGFGGAVATWTDGRAGRHIYAQGVDPWGELGGKAGPKPPKPPKPQSRPRRPATGGGTGPHPR